MEKSEMEGFPNWVKKRYDVLINEIGNETFTVEKAETVLKSANLQIENINKLLSFLRKNGLIKAEPDPYDARKTLYHFIFPQQLGVSKIPKKDDLIKLLKRGADLVRGSVDYKVLLLFLFYKAISDKWEKIKQDFEKQGFSNEQSSLLANTQFIKLYDETEKKLYTWSEVTKQEEIGDLGNAIKKISSMNANFEKLEKVAEVLGLFGFISDENKHLISKLIQEFNSYDFSTVSYDILGDAYEWILSYFAPQKAKEGEVYTPREIIKLIVELLDIEDGTKVLDPACGSGGMLIEAYRYVKKKSKGKEPAIELFGQERNEIIATIAKMNVALHEVENCKIEIGDSLLNPKFDEADYVIANPPWNEDGYDEGNLSTCQIKQAYNTVVSGGYTPKQTADWAWVQLMLYFAKRKVGVILDGGAFFRGGKEEKIRHAFIEKDLIEAVILLPEHLFYNTPASGVIMILNRNKPDNKKGKIILINATKEYEKHPEVKKLNRLSEEGIKKIVEAYKEFKEIDGFSKIVDQKEILLNHSDLSVNRYVEPKEEEEKVDILQVFQELEKLEATNMEVIAKLKEYISEISKLG
jgi:type I restriction enzyme M protein